MPLVIVIVPVVAAAGMVTDSEVAVVDALLATPLAPVKVTVLPVPAVKFVPGMMIVEPLQLAAGNVPTVGSGFTV